MKNGSQPTSLNRRGQRRIYFLKAVSVADYISCQRFYISVRNDNRPKRKQHGM